MKKNILKYLILFEDYFYDDNYDYNNSVDEIQELKNDITQYISTISTNNLIPYRDGYIQIRIADDFFDISDIHLGRNDSNITIYGLLSIDILGNNTDYYRDIKGLKRKFGERYKQSHYSELIQILSIDYDEIDDTDYIFEINSLLDNIKNEIDSCYHIFNQYRYINY